MTDREDVALTNIQKVADASCAMACWLLAYFLRFKVSTGQEGLEWLFIKLAPFVAILTYWSFRHSQLYSSWRFSDSYAEVFSVFKANTLAVVVFVVTLYFFAGERLSRATLIMYYVFSTFTLTILRLAVRNYLRYLRKQGKNIRHILLVGNGLQMCRYVDACRKFKDSGIRFVGWIDSDGAADRMDITEIHQHYKSVVKNYFPDVVVVGYKGVDSGKIENFLKENYNDVISIQILPELPFSFVGHQIDDFAGIPFLSVNRPVYTSLEVGLKRFIDILGSLFGLLVLSPLFLLIGIGIKVSSRGPVFYGQKRIGFQGEEFTMWKFRSMRLPEGDEDLTIWGSEQNPRKTALGNLLRRMSLDELPQLYNVLIGNMSLVGPRPERPHFVDRFREEISNYMLRHKVKVGITGWAQIHGFRGDTDLAKRVEYDIYYIRHWSLLLDLKIILLTFWKGFINKNAY